MIIRGTTPTHTFTLPIDSDQCVKVRIIYAQDNVVLIKIDGDRVAYSGDTVSCKLTQEETQALDCMKLCDVQVRVLTVAGDAMASEIIRVKVGRCLDDEVLK